MPRSSFANNAFCSLEGVNIDATADVTSVTSPDTLPSLTPSDYYTRLLAFPGDAPFEGKGCLSAFLHRFDRRAACSKLQGTKRERDKTEEGGGL